MLVARLCHVSFSPMLKASTTARTNVLFKPSALKNQLLRTFANDGRDSFSQRLARRRTLREKAMAPAGETAFNIGQGALAGGAALGLGALCFYGLGMSKHSGAIDHAVFWPDYVKARIKDTYMYFGSSIVLTAASAAAVLRSPTMLNLVSKSGFMALAATMALMIGSGVITRSIEYRKGFGAKQIAWMIHSGIVGAVIAPICLLGGPIVLRAAWYTAGVVGGLSTIAVCAPSEKFLYIGGPLAIGFGVVLAASLGTMFLGPATALGAGLHSISMYGGLLLFSGFMLYDTQRIIHNAENYPLMASRPFDPVNASISIYLDTINIFIRIAMILAGGGGNKRK